MVVLPLLPEPRPLKIGVPALSSPFRYLLHFDAWMLVGVLVFFACMVFIAPPAPTVRSWPGDRFWFFALVVLPLVWLLGAAGVLVSLIGVCVARGVRVWFLLLLAAHVAQTCLLSLLADHL
jgi:hypothetical protein